MGTISEEEKPLKRGRPALSPDEDSTDVHLTVSASLYDRIYEAAARDRVSIPEVIRRALAKELETQNRQSA